MATRRNPHLIVDELRQSYYSLELIVVVVVVAAAAVVFGREV